MQFFISRFFSSRRQMLFRATSLILLLFLYCSSAFTYENQIELGLQGGYTSMTRSGKAPPYGVGGPSLGVDVGYHLNETIGIGLELDLDFQTPFTKYELGIIDGNGGEDPHEGWVESGTVKRSNVRSITALFTYALDVMRAVPYLSFGISGVQTYQSIEDSSQIRYAVGGRFNLGVYYLLSRHIGLGAALQNEFYLGGTLDFSKRTAFFLKISYIIDRSKAD